MMKYFLVKRFTGLTLLILVVTGCSKQDSPAPDARAKFLGNWTRRFTVSGLSGTFSNPVKIEASPTNSSDIRLYMDGYMILYWTATVAGSQLSYQDQSSSSLSTYSGQGTLSSDGKTITVNGSVVYTVGNGKSQTTSEVWTKQ